MTHVREVSGGAVRQTATPPGVRRTTLARVLDHLGRTLLSLAAGDAQAAPDVSSVIIYDAADEQPIHPGGLVLGVSVHDPAGAVTVVDEAGRHGACAVILREPTSHDAAVHGAAARAGVAVLGLVRGATWAQLASLLDSMLTAADLDDVDDPDTIAGLPAGDLFAVANAISSLLDAPITIEDRSSRVLAFSVKQDDADAPRIETILGRQVPERYHRELEASGTFRSLYCSREPIFVTLRDPDVLPRAAVAVRAGDQILGSIWAVVNEPLTGERLATLRDSANLVALHLLRLRAGADVHRRLRAELVASALEGGPAASAALLRLGLAGQPVIALAVAAYPRNADELDDPAGLELARLTATDALGMHLSALHPRAAVALIDELAYAIVPVVGDAPFAVDHVVRAAKQFTEQVAHRFQALVGIGQVAEGVDALVQSRRDAERVLQVLREGAPASRVARLSDVHVDVLLTDLAALAAADGHLESPAVTRLREYDLKHGTDLLPSLRTWLDGLDVIAAAGLMHVHVNTFRYRLRRIAEVAEVDLKDPDVRFGLLLHLRLLERHAALTGATG